MDSIDDARAFLIARDLIAEHGDNVARFLQDKIDTLMASYDFEQMSVWFIIRNAVSISMGPSQTIQ